MEKLKRFRVQKKKKVTLTPYAKQIVPMLVLQKKLKMLAVVCKR